MGQYMQPDPIGLEGGNPTLYSYVSNPNWWIDPLGLERGVGTSSGVRTPEQAGISPGDARRIQNAANRTNQEIIVVGSRAAGTAHRMSDWDYLMSGMSSQRHLASRLVSRGVSGGSNNRGIDIWSTNPRSSGYVYLIPYNPHVVFPPGG